MISESGARNLNAQESPAFNNSQSFRSDRGVDDSQPQRIQENIKRGHGLDASYSVETVKVARGAEDSIVTNYLRDGE